MMRKTAISALFAAALVGAATLSGPAAAQGAKVSTDPELRRTAEALLVWTMIGVDQARQTRDYSVLRKLGTARFRKAMSSRKLAAELRRIKGRHFAEFHAALKRFPQRLSFSRLEKIGATGLAVGACYCPEGYHLFFRMRYRKFRNTWRIEALKIWDAVD